MAASNRGGSNMNAATFVQKLVGIECWSVVGGWGPGSVISLGFGRKFAYATPLQNKNLTETERLYAPEFNLMVYCAWRLTQKGSIVGGWRDSAPEFTGSTRRPSSPVRLDLDKLVGRRVDVVNINPTTRDLRIRFVGGMEFELFCDVTNDFDSDENYSLSDRKWTCVIGIKSFESFERWNETHE